MSITKLKDRQLYTVCDPQKFDFASTAELEERMSALGQDRAISAVKLGINIKSKGYNLFCLGPEGTGKTSLVKRILEEAAKTRPTPRDWVYVYNFDEPYKPKSISFPAGTACEFAKDIDRLAEDFSVAIPAVLDSDEYKAGVSIIREKYKQKKEEYMRILQKKAKGKSVSLLHMQVGLVVAPVKNGEVLSPEAFDELPENEKQELINDLNLMQEEIEKAAKDLPEWEDRQRRESSLLREKFIKLAVKNPIDSLRQKYKGHREAIEFLKNIQNHIVGNIDEFLPEENAAPAEESDALSALLSRMNKQEEDKFAKFKVNVVVKNEPDSGAPIVHLDHPTQGNLVGRVERIQQYGALLTDFTLNVTGPGAAFHESSETTVCRVPSSYSICSLKIIFGAPYDPANLLYRSRGMLKNPLPSIAPTALAPCRSRSLTSNETYCASLSNLVQAGSRKWSPVFSPLRNSSNWPSPQT